MIKPIPVSCAIILRENKILIAQRSAGMDLPFKWEFPGGKIEANETAEECLIREIHEELNMAIEIKERFESSIHCYAGGKEIELIPFLCRYISGDLILQEHHKAEWFAPESLSSLDWAAADVPILFQFIQWWKVHQNSNF